MPFQLHWPIDEIIGDKVDQAKKRYQELTTNIRDIISDPIITSRVDQARQLFDTTADEVIGRGRDELDVGRKLEGARSRFDELTSGLTDLGEDRDRLMQTRASDIASGIGEGLGQAAAGLGGLGQQALGGLQQRGTDLASGLSGLGAERDRLMQTPASDLALSTGPGAAAGQGFSDLGTLGRTRSDRLGTEVQRQIVEPLRQTPAALGQAAGEFGTGLERRLGAGPVYSAEEARAAMGPQAGAFPEQLGGLAGGAAVGTMDPLGRANRRIGAGYQGAYDLATNLGAPEPLARGVSGVLGTLGAGPSVMGAAMEQGARGVGLSEGAARGVGDVVEAVAPTPLRGDVFGALTRGRVAAAGIGGVAGAGIGAAVSPEEERGLGAVRGGAMGVQLGALPLDLARGVGRLAGRLSQAPGAQSAQRMGIVPGGAEAFDPDSVARANRTSRTAGSFGEAAVVPKLIPQMFTPQQAGEVLDFGSGKVPTHAATLRGLGYDVTAHDFGTNVNPLTHDPNALSKQYDTVYASRVLNTQDGPEMMDQTLGQIAKATRPDGRAIMNYPGDPRYWDDPTGPKLKGVGKASPATVEAHIRKHFQDVRKIGDDNGRPIWEARNPISPVSAAGAGQRMGIVQRDPTRAYHGTGTAYDRVDPGRFAEDGLWGAGYYKTVNPDLAASYAKAGAQPVGREFTADILEELAQRAENSRALYANNPQARATLAQWVREEVEAIRGGVRMPDPVRALRQASSLDDTPEWKALVREHAASIQDTGAQIRPVDIPAGTRYLDIERPVPQEEIDGVVRAIDNERGPGWGDEFREELLGYADEDLDTPGEVTGAILHHALTGVYGWNKNRVNRFLASAGFDGITHEGGRNMPLLDADGNPIRHQVFVTFEEGLPKLRNALSGQPMGITRVPPGTPRPLPPREPGRLTGAAPATARGALEDVRSQFFGDRTTGPMAVAERVSGPAGFVAGAATGPEDQSIQDRLKRGLLVGLSGARALRSATEIAAFVRSDAPAVLARLERLGIAGGENPDLFREEMAGRLAKIQQGMEQRLEDHQSLTVRSQQLQEEIGALSEMATQKLEKPPNRGVWAMGGKHGLTQGDYHEIARRSELNPYEPGWYQNVDDETVRLYKQEVTAQRSRIAPETPEKQLQRMRAELRSVNKDVKDLDQRLMQDMESSARLEEEMANVGIAASRAPEPEAPAARTPEGPPAGTAEEVAAEVQRLPRAPSPLVVPRAPGTVRVRRRGPVPSLPSATGNVQPGLTDPATGRPVGPERAPRVEGEGPFPAARAPEAGRVARGEAEGVRPQAAVPTRTGPQGPPNPAPDPRAVERSEMLQDLHRRGIPVERIRRMAQELGDDQTYPEITAELRRSWDWALQDAERATDNFGQGWGTQAQGALIDPATGRPVQPERGPQVVNPLPEEEPLPGTRIKAYPQRPPGTPGDLETMVPESGELVTVEPQRVDVGELQVGEIPPERPPQEGVAVLSERRGPLDQPAEVGRMFPGRQSQEPEPLPTVTRGPAEATPPTSQLEQIGASAAVRDARAASAAALKAFRDAGGRLPEPGQAPYAQTSRSAPRTPLTPEQQALWGEYQAARTRVQDALDVAQGNAAIGAGPPGPPRPPGGVPRAAGDPDQPAGQQVQAVLDGLDEELGDLTPGTEEAVTKAQKIAKISNQARYINLLAGTATALGDIVANTINIGRLYGRTIIASGVEGMQRMPVEQRATTFSQLTGLDRGIREGGVQGVKEAWDVLWHGYSRSQEARRAGGAANPDVSDEYFRGPGWVLPALGYRIRLAADSLVVNVGERMASYSLGYREADRAGLKAGTGAHTEYAENVARHVQGEMERIRQTLKPGERVPQGGVTPRKAPPATYEQAGQFGEKTTPAGASIKSPFGERLDYNALAREAFATSRDLAYQRNLGAATEAIADVRMKIPLMQAVVAFFRTSSRISQDMIQMDPVLGTIGTAQDAVKAAFGKGPWGAVKGDPASSIFSRSRDAHSLPLSQRLADQAMGVMIATAGAAFAANGVLTGPGPNDAAVKRKMLNEGWRPGAWAVPDGEGGIKGYIPLARLVGAYAMPLMTGASVYEMFSRGESPLDDPQAAITSFLMSQEGMVSSQSGLRDIYELLNVPFTPDPDEAARTLERLAANVVGQHVPLVGLLRQASGVWDEVQRDPRNVQERLAADIPFTRHLVEPRRTETGEVITRGPGERGLRAFLPLQEVERAPGLRQYEGSRDAAMDAEITRAINAVRDYNRDEEQFRPPTSRQESLYEEFVGTGSPDFRTARREERARRRTRGAAEADRILGFTVPTSGG